MKHAAAFAAAIASLSVLSLPHGEYTSETGMMQRTIAQALPPYRPVDEAQVESETAKAARPAQSADAAPKMPDAAAEATPAPR